MFSKIVTFLLALTLLAGSAWAAASLTSREQLGKDLFFDKIASPDMQSCAACHAPEVGFTGPNPGINGHGGVYRGAVAVRFGNRKPPSSAYATLSPVFHYDMAEELFEGGNFWDGRATGDRLGNPAADQALGPFLNPVEQNNPSKRAVLEQIAAAPYAVLWEIVWGEPLMFETESQIETNYDRVGLAIAAYEGSSEVNAYSSKFDAYTRGEIQLTAQEQLGMQLFNGKGNCAACHPAPLFTDFTFDNLGAPKNPENPFYRMDQVFLDNGQPINPQGAAWIDPGLGGFLATLPVEYFTALGLDRDETVAENWGKHKVPTLRNVDRRHGIGFPKAFLHNGVFKSLEDVVHFYNTRDAQDWPPPEVAANVNTDELGDLGLTLDEERAIVAFLGTLSDGFQRHGKGHDRVIASGGPVRLDVMRPTPFAPRTQLMYDIPASGAVSVMVFDVTGRRVATLADGWTNAGQHSLDWSALNVASGNYWIRLQSPDGVVSRKVTIIR